jgi:hypothetical protein
MEIYAVTLLFFCNPSIYPIALPIIFPNVNNRKIYGEFSLILDLLRYLVLQNDKQDTSFYPFLIDIIESELRKALLANRAWCSNLEN